MALILQDIYEESRRRYQLELLAGGEGLHRVMQWVYVAEDYTTADFLHGGELIITTGVISGGSPDWLLRFLRHILPQGPCGVIVNVGPYLHRRDITREVVELCDRNRLPLMLMPWHVHIYDITRDYYDRIFLDNRRDEAVNGAFLSLLDPAADHTAALTVLSDCRYPAAAPYYVVAFGLTAQREPVLADNSGLMGSIRSRLAGLDWPCYLASRNGALFLICQQGEPEQVQDIVARLQEIIGEEAPVPALWAGIGGRVDHLEALSASCRQARAALNLGLYRKTPLCRYEEMGFFKLLLEVSDRQVLRAYVDAHLAPVRAYDARHSSDFARTLYLYILYDQSIQAVADAVYCHRNTIRHRLRLLQEMGYRLDDPMARFELMTAFLTEEYLRTQEPPQQG